MKKLLSTLGLTALLGCNQFYTPGGIAVAVGEFNPDLTIIDTKYELTEKCLRENNVPIKGYKEDVMVSIVTDQDFWDYHGMNLRGRYYPEMDEIEITESLKALGHEFNHHITDRQDHFEPKCGDQIDSQLNHVQK